MRTSRLRTSAIFAAAVLTGGIAVGVIGGGTASASITPGAVGAVTAPTTTPPIDHGTVIEVPRTAPFTVDLARAFQRGTVFSIAVFENPTTGYLWSSSLSSGSEPTVALVSTNYVQDPAPDGMVGVGGTRYFTFQALDSGRAVITLLYQRSWEPRPMQRVTLDLCVN